MRIELNLASRPTENRRRFLVLAGTAIVVLTALAVFQIAVYLRDWGSGRSIPRRTSELQAELKQLEADQKDLEQRLQRPEAVRVFDASNFLNSLILQKSFSWTQLFMDMEKLMPADVQIMSIRPTVVEANQIRLDLSAVGKSTDELLEFVRRLERSEKFSTAQPHVETPPTGGADITAKLTLTVMYVQK